MNTNSLFIATDSPDYGRYFLSRAPSSCPFCNGDHLQCSCDYDPNVLDDLPVVVGSVVFANESEESFSNDWIADLPAAAAA